MNKIKKIINDLETGKLNRNIDETGEVRNLIIRAKYEIDEWTDFIKDYEKQIKINKK